MDFTQAAKEILQERIEKEVSKHSLLMKVNETQEVLGIDDHAQMYRMMNNDNVPGAQKIPGMGWRINRDIFFMWLYFGEIEITKIQEGSN